MKKQIKYKKTFELKYYPIHQAIIKQKHPDKEFILQETIIYGRKVLKLYIQKQKNYQLTKHINKLFEFLYFYIQITFSQCEEFMDKLSSFFIIKHIKDYALQIRTKLTIFGLSSLEINFILQRVLKLDEDKNREGALKNQENIKLGQLNLQQNHFSFESTLRRCLSFHKDDVQGFLLALLQKLDIFRSKLEEQQSRIQFTIKNIDQQNHKKQFVQRSIMSSALQEMQQCQKISNVSSTEMDSLQAQQSKLELSLESLLLKTQMLRSMLRHQMRVTPIRELEKLWQRSSSGINEYGSFSYSF